MTELNSKKEKSPVRTDPKSPIIFNEQKNGLSPRNGTLGSRWGKSNEKAPNEVRSGQIIIRTNQNEAGKTRRDDRKVDNPQIYNIQSAQNLVRNMEFQDTEKRENERKRQRQYQRRKSQANQFYPGNTYIYPYYYDSSGCYYWPCCNGHCCPSRQCHSNYHCSMIFCDPYPCCNGCHGFHCGCLNCFPCCSTMDCVQNNHCGGCQCLPCCSGCQFCYNSCDGACVSALPCCNDCQCSELCYVIPCCNGCECQDCLGCLPCCNDAVCNAGECFSGCWMFNCIQHCGNGDCGNCDCGNCDCNCDCGGCDCDCGGCDCDCGGCDCLECCGGFICELLCGICRI